MSRCACCGGEIDGGPAFVHPAVPRFLNVLAATEGEARDAPTGRIELFECPSCGFVFNRAFSGLPYGRDYFLDATRSARYRRHLDDVSDRLAKHMSGRSRFSVVDVGAGQGTFLAHLVDRLGDRVAAAHGFDPSFRAEQAGLPEPVGCTSSELDAAAAASIGFVPDAVVSRHVVEHVPDPVSFLASVRTSLPAGFEMMVETPNLSHTLARGLLHDFCYEHCAMMTDSALAHALRRAGYDRVQVETAFGGEYLLAFARAPASGVSIPAESVPERDDAAVELRLAALAERFVAEHRQRLSRSRRPIAIWGGAGKGALLAHLIDPDRSLLDMVIDIHPAKHGSFLPGAAHPVVSPADASRAEVKTVLVANPTYKDEIVSQCEGAGIRAAVLCAGIPAD